MFLEQVKTVSVPLSEFVFLIDSIYDEMDNFYICFRPLVGVCISNQRIVFLYENKNNRFRPLVGVCISNPCPS